MAKPTICLNMIVKNEESNIGITLSNLSSYIKFDYWVICDTGSTDKTKEIITAHFKKEGIDGELLDHEWVDFSHNRTKALESAFGKTDYVLIFDADDRITGNFRLPETMDKDRYNLKIGKGFEFQRPLLMTNRKRWCFKGVLHEYLSEIDVMDKGYGVIEGDYHVVPGVFGCRSKNPNKYYDDAIILKAAFEKEMVSEDGDRDLAYRYAFYCAQSYKDVGGKYTDEAIEWYKKVALELPNWSQEKYYSCLMLGNLYKSKNDNENATKYWLKTIEYDPERIEGVVNAMEYYRESGQNLLVNLLYHRFKTYKKSFSLDSNKLFIDMSKYADLIEYNNSICAYYVDDKESGHECCKRIINNNVVSRDLLERTLLNMKFYI